MKYRGKEIDYLFRNKNWEGVKPFTDRFGLDVLIQLEQVVAEKDWEKLKSFVQRYGIEPLVEYGMPVDQRSLPRPQAEDRRRVVASR